MFDEDLQERTILLVDAAPSAALIEDFVTLGFRLFVADNAESARLAAAAIQPEFLLLEVCIGAVCGIGLMVELLSLSPAAKAAIVTMSGSIESARAAVSRGAVDYFTRPVTGVEVITALLGSDQKEGAAEVPMGIQVMRRRYIQEALTRFGSLAKASRVLHIERKSLRRMLRRLTAG